MKALSIRQPWAWLIVHGIKDIENRDWATNYRGEFLIHASKTFDSDGYDFIRKTFSISMPKSWQFELGGIIGIANLIECVDSHPSKWFFGKYGFVISDAKPLNFVALRGKQMFFDVELAFNKNNHLNY